MSVRLSTLLFIGLAFCIAGLFYVSLPPAHQASCDCANKVSKTFQERMIALQEKDNDNYRDDYGMAVLVPFRDRFEELLEFAPHIHSFLNSQKIKHHIFIVNQIDNLRFNRASLLNAGFLETTSDFDYFALHDVDLLPTNPKLIYSFPANGPFHVAAPHLHPRYHYPTFIGGILLVRREHYLKVDGMSNRYWGWGLEDDEFYARLKEAKLKIFRPGNLTTTIKDTFRHIHNRKVRKRDMIKCYNQQEITRRRDRQTGLSSTKYELLSRKEIKIDGAPVTILNIALECNHSSTPWCNCTESVGNNRRPKAFKSRGRQDVIVPRIDKKKHISPEG